MLEPLPNIKCCRFRNRKQDGGLFYKTSVIFIHKKGEKKMTEQEIKWENEKFEMKKRSFELMLQMRDHLEKMTETCNKSLEILKGVSKNASI